MNKSKYFKEKVKNNDHPEEPISTSRIKKISKKKENNKWSNQEYNSLI